MDIRTMLLRKQYKEAVARYGQEAVKEEIDEMIFHDLADRALEAAQALGYSELRDLANRVVRNSGSYNR